MMKFFGTWSVYSQLLVIATFWMTCMVTRTVDGLTPQWKSAPSSALSWKIDDETEPYSYTSTSINLLDLDTQTQGHGCSSGRSTLDDPLTLSIRGGGERKNPVLQGTKTSLATTAEFWQKAFSDFGNKITRPFRGVGAIRKPSFLLSEQERKQNDLLKKLQTTPIQQVKIVPESSVVPPQVIQMAAKRSGLLGKPLQSTAIQDVARSLKQWYERRGYVLHSMTGATLQVDTQTAELTVEEPKSCTRPVQIIFCKEMIIDPDDGSLLTKRQYKEKIIAQNRLGGSSSSAIDRSQFNTTFVPTDAGRTSPTRLAKALGLRPGQDFMWHPDRWARILQSGIFRKALRATPERMPDGTVQLQLVVQEAPSRNLEYGLSKSLYTNSWEGEVDFMHRNLLGGGESLGVTVKRGTHDAEPSVRVQYSDHQFSDHGGYDVQLFTDYIGEHLDESAATSDGSSESSTDTSPSSATATAPDDYDHDELLDRKGASISIRNPLSQFSVANAASACLERTSTKGGHHESIGSATLNIGPLARDLPLAARTSVFGRVTAGTRLGERQSADARSSPSLLPFTSLSATTRQLFPLSSLSGNTIRPPIVLALSHTATTSTRHLPRHEATAQGNACKIRGHSIGSSSKASERVSSSLTGTTELRIPVSIPRLDDALSVVIFGDWCLAQRTARDAFVRRSCLGVGIRKSLQGLPLKYDVTYNAQDHKVGALFGLGPDFSV